MAITTILFDLDGTLLDTAPDLGHALNTLLAKNAKAPVPLDKVRQVAGNGSIGLLKLGFNIGQEHEDFQPLRTELLHLYEANMTRHTTPFAGVDMLIRFLDAHDYRWGIVTNKPHWLTEALLPHFDFSKSAACVVSGNTVARAKPFPDPLLHACELMKVKAEECIYVGDGQRDIVAGNAAGMKTILVTYGYIPEDEDIDSWGADEKIDKITDLIERLS